MKVLNKVPVIIITYLFQVVKNHIDDTIQGLKKCLEEEAIIRERKQSLFCLSKVITSINKVNFLLSDEDKFSQPASIEVVERAASEFALLHFFSSRCLSIMSRSQIETCEKFEKILMDNLNQLLLQSVRAKESGQISRYLRMFVNLDKASVAERHVREAIVSPFLYDLVCENSLQKEKDGLQGIYQKVLQFVDTELSPLLELPAELGAHFNFLLNSLWLELANHMNDHMKSVFSAGDPNEFHTRYRDTTHFLNSLEKRLQNTDNIRALTNHIETRNFQQKWNLLVYYKIR